MLPDNLMPKVANISDPRIKALCTKIAPDETAVYLKIEPSDNAVINECYGNIEEMIKKNGGAIQYGWQIWETLPEIFAEAEFHAVWVDSTGVPRDVTPKAIPNINQVLFLADPARKFEGRQVDSFRIPLKNDMLIEQFIDSAERLFKSLNEGELSDQFGEIKITPEMEKIMNEKKTLELSILRKYYL